MPLEFFHYLSLPPTFRVEEFFRSPYRLGEAAAGTIIKVDVKALTVSDVMLAMIANPFSVVYLSVLRSCLSSFDINPPLKKRYNCTRTMQKSEDTCYTMILHSATFLHCACTIETFLDGLINVKV